MRARPRARPVAHLTLSASAGHYLNNSSPRYQMSASYCLDAVPWDAQEVCPFTSDDLDENLDNSKKHVVASNLGIYLRHSNTHIGKWFELDAFVAPKLRQVEQGHPPDVPFISLARGRLRNVFGCENVGGLRVFIKCFVCDPTRNPWIGGLEYEHDVYSCAVSNFKSPFSIYAYASFKKEINIDDAFEDALVRQHPSSRLPRHGPATFMYSVTEDIGGPNLWSLVHSRTCDYVTFIKFTFQMLAAAAYLNGKKITHNDLHWGNVLVDQNAPEFWLDTSFNDVLTDDMVIDGKESVILQDKGMVKIFDWDRTVMQDKTNEAASDVHTEVFKPSYDTISILKTWEATVKNRHHCQKQNVFLALFKKCFRDVLLADYPWILGYAGEISFQTVCKPAQPGHVGCDQEWPSELDKKVKRAVIMFRSELITMVPVL